MGRFARVKLAQLKAARLHETAVVNAIVGKLKAGGCNVEWVTDGGYKEAVTVSDPDGVTVFGSLRKGTTDAWITSYYEGSEMIEWDFTHEGTDGNVEVQEG